MRIRPDVLTPLDRFLTGATSPTVDLYFTRPCRDFVNSGQIRQIAPTVFQCGQTLVIIRHALGLKSSVVFDRLIYVMDDDWRGGLSGSSLPALYRAKLAAVEKRAANRFEKLADIIVTSSIPLASQYRERFPEKRIEMVLPTWPVVNRSGINPERMHRLAYLGSWSHQKDFELIDASLVRLLKENKNVELLLSGHTKPSEALRRQGRLKIIPPMAWSDYSEWLLEQHFDIGIYPLKDTPFNRARSINKLLEYHQTGAVTVASDVWDLSGLQANESLYAPVRNAANNWSHKLEEILKNKDMRQRIRANANAAIKALAIEDSNRSLWAELLQLG